MGRAGTIRAGVAVGGAVLLAGGLLAAPLGAFRIAQLRVVHDQRAAVPLHRSAPESRSVAARVPVAENDRRGTTSWRLGRRGAEQEIEGYADRVSVLPGEPFRLFVSTTAPAFRVAAFRMGWYGGTQGRRLWASAELPGRVQPPPTVLPVTDTVTTRWAPALTVATAGWPPGAYLLKLTASTGGHRFVPLVVRSPSTAGRVVLVLAVNTWQAYNAWGGYSLYTGPDGAPADRSRAVSFDRPYDRSGAPKFLAYDRPVVAEAERLGLPTAYLTSVDLATVPGVLRGARAVVSLGHDEYWTPAMRAALTRARDAGTNVAFLGANAVYWRVRYEPSPLGPDRLLVGWKSAADPVASRDPADTTVQFRQAPAPDPEETLVGQRYACFSGHGPGGSSHAAFRIEAPGFWGFAGTGVRRGSAFPGLVGVEVDRVPLLPTTPRPIEVVAVSPFSCPPRPTVSTSTYYTVASGAGVFSVGTMSWVCALDDRCGRQLPAASGAFVRRVTDTVLRVFAAGPAGLTHPARDNLDHALAGW